MLASKALGFLRQAFIADAFGASASTDVYFIANDFMVNMSGAFTTALSTALIAVYIDVAARNGKQKAGHMVSRTLTVYLMVSASVAIILSLFAQPLGRLLMPVNNDAQLAQLVFYLRMFSVALVFSAIQAIYAAVLNANERFVHSKFYGLIFNPLAIAAVLFLGPYLEIRALIVAYYVANVLQTMLLHFSCRRTFSFRPVLRKTDDDLSQIWKLALPILISNVVVQLNGVIDKAICSLLGTGITSIYTYAHTLEQFVTGTFTATITMVLFPRIANTVSTGEEEQVRKLLDRAVKFLLVVLIPVALISVLCTKGIVALVYERGAFTKADTAATALALIGFAVGFPLVAVRELLIRVHVAYQQAKTAMTINILAVVLNVMLSLTLSRWIGIFGVTIATSLSALLSTILLLASLRKHLPVYRFRSTWTILLRTLPALALCAVAVLAAGQVPGLSLLFRVALQLAAGCAAYGLLWLIINHRWLRSEFFEKP